MSTEPSPQQAASDSIWTTRRLLQWITEFLDRKGVDAPRLSAELLVAHVLQCERLRLYMDNDRPATTAEREALRGLVERAGRHEPIQYLLGTAWFFGLEFEVNPEVLIPRPSTETVVDFVAQREKRQELDRIEAAREEEASTLRARAEAMLADHPDTRASAESVASVDGPADSGRGEVVARSTTEPGPLRIVDIGTGSGAIAIALLATLRRAHAVATDIAASSLAVARSNARRAGVEDRVQFLEGSLLEPLRDHPDFGAFDYLVANPPYIADPDWDDVDRNVRDYEPARALRAGRDGLDILRPLIAVCHAAIRPGGWVVIEIGAYQGPAVRQLAAENPDLEEVDVLRDHENFERVLVARRR